MIYSYSQNNEDVIIGAFFGSFNGHLLSLGENDGRTLSNSRALIEKGWSGDLVEPAPKAFERLEASYKMHPVTDDNNIAKVKLHNVAIGNYIGEMPFYESGTLLNESDTDLVSTLSINETKRWRGKVAFKETKVKVITFEELLKYTMQKTFDFISIDCEGYDYDILKQMNLEELKCRCVCVEFNGQNECLYDAHVKQYGFRLLHKNAENLIYVR